MIIITVLCIAMIFIQCLTPASPQDAGREAAALKVKKLARKLEKTAPERKERRLPEKRQLAGTNICIRWTSGKKALDITTTYYSERSISLTEAAGARVQHIPAYSSDCLGSLNNDC